jgi:hypothetical protein
LWKEYVFNGAYDRHDPAVEETEGLDSLMDELDQLADLEKELVDAEADGTISEDEHGGDQHRAMDQEVEAARPAPLATVDDEYGMNSTIS